MSTKSLALRSLIAAAALLALSSRATAAPPSKLAPPAPQPEPEVEEVAQEPRPRVPHNHAGLAWLDLAAATDDERQAARAALQTSRPGLAGRLEAGAALAEASPMVRWLAADQSKGKAAEALDPRLQAWFKQVASLSPDRRGRLLQGKQPIEIPWDEVAPELQEALGRQLRLEPSPRAVVRLEPRSAWMPLPTRALQGTYRDGAVHTDPVRFGLAPWAVGLKGSSNVDWMAAGKRYGAWTTLTEGPVSLHHGREVAAAAASALLGAMAEQARIVAEYAELEPAQIAPIDVFVYASHRSLVEYTLPSFDFALPYHRQVHQARYAPPGEKVAQVLLSDAWGPPATAFAREGVAVFFNGATPVIEQAKNARLRAQDVDVATTLRRFEGTEEDRRVAGLFAAFVDARDGAGALEVFFSAPEPFRALAARWEIKDHEVRDAFKAWLTEQL